MEEKLIADQIGFVQGAERHGVKFMTDIKKTDSSVERAPNLEPLIAKVANFCEARDWDQFHDIKELAIGLITESSELLELFRFQNADECATMLNQPTKREKIEDELADVFFFLLRLSGRYKIDLASALENKMAKNELKYPVERSRGNNRKYDEL